MLLVALRLRPGREPAHADNAAAVDILEVFPGELPEPGAVGRLGHVDQGTEALGAVVEMAAPDAVLETRVAFFVTIRRPDAGLQDEAQDLLGHVERSPIPAQLIMQHEGADRPVRLRPGRPLVAFGVRLRLVGRPIFGPSFAIERRVAFHIADVPVALRIDAALHRVEGPILDLDGDPAQPFRHAVDPLQPGGVAVQAVAVVHGQDHERVELRVGSPLRCPRPVEGVVHQTVFAHGAEQGVHHAIFDVEVLLAAAHHPERRQRARVLRRDIPSRVIAALEGRLERDCPVAVEHFRVQAVGEDVDRELGPLGQVKGVRHGRLVPRSLGR